MMLDCLEDSRKDADEQMAIDEKEQNPYEMG